MSTTAVDDVYGSWADKAQDHGLTIIAEGGITDDGAGNLTLEDSLMIINPLTGTYIRVAADTFALGVWGALAVKIPPTVARGAVISAQVIAWVDADRKLADRDMLVLAVRENNEAIWLRNVSQLASNVSGDPPGTLLQSAAIVTPAGYLYCDGASVSKNTYGKLWFAAMINMGAATISIASPGVVTKTAHGLIGGERIHFETTGALPTGLTTYTDYWVIPVDANTFRLANSITNYLSSTAINTSGTQSGVHTLIHAPHGVASSTNFNLPDYRGRQLVMPAGSGGKALIRVLGLHDDRAQSLRSPSHHHLADKPGTNAFAGGASGAATSAFSGVATTGDANNRDYGGFGTANVYVKY